jgi:hypothetical protein
MADGDAPADDGRMDPRQRTRPCEPTCLCLTSLRARIPHGLAWGSTLPQRQPADGRAVRSATVLLVNDPIDLPAGVHATQYLLPSPSRTHTKMRRCALVVVQAACLRARLVPAVPMQPCVFHFVLPFHALLI